MKIFSLLFIFLLASIYVAAVFADLYSNDPNVVSLTGDNLYENILNQDRITVAIFYANWCGGCVRISATIKAFAQQIRNWRKVVQVVGLDCASYSNVCANEGITSYPSIYLIPPKSSSTSEAQALELYQFQTQELIYEAVLQYVIADPFIVSHYTLTSVFVTKKEEICNTFVASNRSATAFVIVEPTPSVTSAELILDLLPYRRSVLVQRFNSDQHLLNRIHVHLPAILEVNLISCTFKPLKNFGQDLNTQKPDFLKAIRDQYPPDESNSVILKAERKSSEIIKVTKYKLTYIDLYNALRYSLLTEVPRFKTLDRTQVLVLKQYFAILLKYFPFRNENVRRLFKRMNNWFANKNSTLKAVQYREAMRISDGFLKPMESWRHCNGSKPQYRGYPCGVWTLFHTLTVGEYHWLQRGASVKHEVLATMRDYVKSFFSCKECAEHFSQATLSMESELAHPNSSVLFLWRIHNQVNHRLQGDATEDPYFPKIQFPSQKSCPQCVVMDQFDKPQVLNFLVNYYDKKSIQNGAISMHGLSSGWLLFVLLSVLLQFY